MPHRALLFSAGADTAGTNIRSVEAFAACRKVDGRETDWLVRSMVSSSNYIEYPIDLPYSPMALAHAYDEADVVVHNAILYGHTHFDNGQGKPAVLYHHGVHAPRTHFHLGLEELIAEGEEIGAVQAGSTVNLELFGPITWVPTAYDLSSLERMRRNLYSPESSGKIRVFQSPTDRSVKSTADLVAAVDILVLEGLPVELILVEGQTHFATLVAKASFADIVVDQLHLGYGCNAIEAWGMGIPVIAGFTDHEDWEEHAVKRYGCVESRSGLPFYSATPETLVEALRALVESQALREAWGAAGLCHAIRHHSQAAHVKVMSKVLDTALNHPTVPGPTRGNIEHLEAKWRRAKRLERIADNRRRM